MRSKINLISNYARAKNNELIIIPLEKIEHIGKAFTTNSNGEVSKQFIQFDIFQKQTLIDKNGKKSENYILNLTYQNNISSNPSRNIDKLIKAFNHLRKLCGAPEPISFD